MPRWGEATGETPANADDLGLPNITVYQALQDIYIYLGKLQRPHCDRALESWLIRGIIPKWPYFR
jgi:hypothetical protein